ncbi:transketolase family protein [Sediminitomix flava]|uniref:transketolase n=1 Tax=Sediminitomix flava TaxID=379075 RepID=A0A315ZCH7_SEDFL|nr:transketolase [Sediminitomix flava]PWJ42819.1 transketolase [Sediminitomix flava]
MAHNKQTNIDLTNKAVNNIRILSAAMVEKAKSGHPGGAMGGADFIHILYSEFLKFNPSDPTWIHRDRFFMDAGHMSPMLYSILTLQGKYDMEELRNFRQWGSLTPGHPEVDILRGVENTSGPLGQGHAMAVGAAIVERFLCSKFGEWMAHKTYAFISDGGIQEEVSQGAGRIAGFLGLSNLIMFYDANKIQLSTPVSEVTDEDTKAKYEAWGWNVIEVDGHDHVQIRKALTSANEETKKPTLIIGHTIIGKGAVDEDGNPFEGKTSLHGQPLSGAGASFEKTIENLGGDINDPFQVFPEVASYYDGVNKCMAEYVSNKQHFQANWEMEKPELAQKLRDFFEMKTIEKVDFSSIAQKSGAPTRAASSLVLSTFADEIENMIVASADLSNSDKTDGFLKKTTVMSRDNHGGRFLQVGVSELTMACLANGMALHGGVIPVVGTFFVFSDYMKPAYRLSALMELPVKFVWTHDAFRVGEDGPTHQPVEHEAQIRLMEKLQNHKGKNSMLALRPSDAEETTVAWEMALKNTETPSALILSRQNIKSLPTQNGSSRYEEAKGANQGGYIVLDSDQPDVILIGSGSEVSTLVGGAELLKEYKVRVVAIPSEGLFKIQPPSYQDKVLPNDIPKFGLTAGLPSTLRELVGDKGQVWGLNHFGHSAPAGVLDEKFGFTAENVAKEVRSFLKSLA